MRCYRKLVFKDGVLTGAILIGQSEDIGTLYTFIKKGFKIEAQAQKILKHGISYAELVKDKLLI
ncbi:MAG TPA: hypothetical protein VKY40_01110 [Halanaerobiales bacterium]|nr:hypothetical protein [Halanaerobiales bacterium]